MGKELEILQYKKYNKGTALQVFIPTHDMTELLDILSKKAEGKLTGEIFFDDPRRMSTRQRNKIQAIINDIRQYSGNGMESTRNALLEQFNETRQQKLNNIFNFSIMEAKEFIDFILEFAFEWDVPLSRYNQYKTDNLDFYLFLCLRYRKCAVCGLPGEIHHESAIGMGRDRNKIDDSNLKKICLCRKCHQTAHQMGVIKFREKYKVYGIYYTE
jgi:hypothetical protein